MKATTMKNPLALFSLLLSTPLSLTSAFPTDVAVSRDQRSLNTAGNDNYCGTTWPNAAETCSRPCPSGEDSECGNNNNNNNGLKCFMFTGCSAKISAEEEETETDNNDNANDNASGNSVAAAGENNNFCGSSWLAAMLTCNDPCPMGTECQGGETCFAATNCDKPLLELVSDLLVTLNGPDRAMDNQDGGIFTGTMMDILREVAEQEGIALDGIDLGDQALQGRRELQQRRMERSIMGLYDDHYLFSSSQPTLSITNITQRKLPSGSSALDVSMVITGDYRPPPYIDLNVIAEDSINRQGDKVVSTLRERGSRAGRDFFDRVDSIEAVAKEKVTARPTRTPTGKPTPGPTGPPTAFPSLEPSLSPSDEPSSVPSRAHMQYIMTGSREDLAIGGSTTKSYGYIFNTRTPKDGPAIMITGLDFYTETTENIDFELWSRLGSFQDAKGSYEGWDLIASGTVKGRGTGRYTSIPEEMFSSVAIPGGGGDKGTRAFYLTLTSTNLVYKVSSGMSPDTVIDASSPDLEIYEGEGVLFYPFPDPSMTMFYRGPRQFLGGISYDRLPCKPYSAFGDIMDLPCPDLPTASPTRPQPTQSPVTEPPTMTPVTETPTTGAPIFGQTEAPVAPTLLPTENPTVSMKPTAHPTTALPTASPIVPMRGNILVTLRNTPERLMTDREIEKFLEITTDFLIRHTESSMIIVGIDFWHQELIQTEGIDNATVSGLNEPESEELEHEDAEPDDSEPETPKATPSTRDLSKRMKQVKEQPAPLIPATEVTLILRVSHSNLPLNLIGKMAAVAIEEKQVELLALLNEQSAFYTYFKFMNGLESRMIDRVTSAPTDSPTTYAAYLANQAILEAEDVVAEEPKELGFGVFVGLGIGAMWCLLTACSLAYLYRARSQMTEDKDLEDLLKQEKADPIETSTKDEDSDEKKKLGESSATIPLGDGEIELDDDNDGNNVASDISDSEDESVGGKQKSSSIFGRSSSTPIKNAPAKTGGWKARAQPRNKTGHTRSSNDAGTYNAPSKPTGKPDLESVGNMRAHGKSWDPLDNSSKDVDVKMQGRAKMHVMPRSKPDALDESSRSNDYKIKGSMKPIRTYRSNSDLDGSNRSDDRKRRESLGGASRTRTPNRSVRQSRAGSNTRSRTRSESNSKRRLANVSMRTSSNSMSKNTEDLKPSRVSKGGEMRRQSSFV